MMRTRFTMSKLTVASSGQSSNRTGSNAPARITTLTSQETGLFPIPSYRGPKGEAMNCKQEVRTPKYRVRVVGAGKGKGSYKRQKDFRLVETEKDSKLTKNFIGYCL